MKLPNVTHGAQETESMQPPPVADVAWTAHRKGSPHASVRVTARRWMDARDEAARLLGCEPGELVVTLVVEGVK